MKKLKHVLKPWLPITLNLDHTWFFTKCKLTLATKLLIIY